MRALLLGTGAADIHAPERCACANCAAVRRRAGRSIRTYTSTLFDGELLVDCGPTVPNQIDRFVPECRLRYILITHPDGDHFDPEAITRLAEARASADCAILGSPPVIERLRRDARAAEHCRLRCIAALETIRLGSWTVTALPARHRGEAGDSLIYILSRNGRSLLYATDTGPLPAAAWNMVRRYRLDAVIAEATFGPHTDGIPDLGSAHMNFPLVCELRTKLLRERIIGDGAPFMATHLSLHFCPPHEESDKILAACGIRAGYDGAELIW